MRTTVMNDATQGAYLLNGQPVCACVRVCWGGDGSHSFVGLGKGRVRALEFVHLGGGGRGIVHVAWGIIYG